MLTYRGPLGTQCCIVLHGGLVQGTEYLAPVGGASRGTAWTWREGDSPQTSHDIGAYTKPVKASC